MDVDDNRSGNTTAATADDGPSIAKRIMRCRDTNRGSSGHIEVMGLSSADLVGRDWSHQLKLVKSAYRRLAVVLHPDKNASDPDCSTAFTLVNTAKEFLTNSELEFGRALNELAGRERRSRDRSGQGAPLPQTDLEAFFTSPKKPTRRHDDDSSFSEFVRATRPSWEQAPVYAATAQYTTFGATHPNIGAFMSSNPFGNSARRRSADPWSDPFVANTSPAYDRHRRQTNNNNNNQRRTPKKGSTKDRARPTSPRTTTRSPTESTKPRPSPVPRTRSTPAKKQTSLWDEMVQKRRQQQQQQQQKS